MVNFGIFPVSEQMPSPNLSYLRLFAETAKGWTHQGQYIIWCSQVTAAEPYRLLERFDNKVLEISDSLGGPVFHRIPRNTPFFIDHLMRFWVGLDSDALWLDTGLGDKRYVLLTVGGARQKPSAASIDWPCVSCGAVLFEAQKTIFRQGFDRLLQECDALIAEFNQQKKIRTCTSCGAEHPAV